MGIDLETPSADHHNACLDDSTLKAYGDGTNFNSSNNVGPHEGMEFESKEEAFLFYKEYAMSLGFTCIVKASRRSRISGKFIDAKFVCTRYGSKKETSSTEVRDDIPSTESMINPHKKKRGRTNRSWSKTDCKACLHVKRRQDGRWIVRAFIEEHNHEISPNQAHYIAADGGKSSHGKSGMDSLHAGRARGTKMSVSMTRESERYKKLGKQKSLLASQIGGCQVLGLEKGDGGIMLDFFANMQAENPYFFYAIDLNEDHRLRNVFWVDAKSRADYKNFSDVISLDTTYVKKEYKLPLVPFVGVNHHGQLLLLGCGLIAHETKTSYVWLMRVWLKAMGGRPPMVILTDQQHVFKEAVSEVFPCSRHCFPLWNISEQVPEKLGDLMGQQEEFMTDFNDCLFRSCMNEIFENKWWKMVDKFKLENNDWFASLYEDRQYWVPIFMKDSFLAGMSTMQRSECVNSHFDKYLQRKSRLKEFIEQYKTILLDRCDEEAKADFETWHRQAGLKSPSPFGKQMSTVYTHAIFKKFQVEVVGGVACHPRILSESGPNKAFKVQDFEENHDFDVVWNNESSDISCTCQLFEFSGFLCRHVMIVLQMSGVQSIPSQYVLKRWTRDAKSRDIIGEETNTGSCSAQYYKDLCFRALKLSDEGSLSEESYNFVLNAMEEALSKCENMSRSWQQVAEPMSPAAQCPHGDREDSHVNSTFEMNGNDGLPKTGQVHPERVALSFRMSDGYCLQEHADSRPSSLDGYFALQQPQRGTGQINPLASDRGEYYANQHNIQGLAQINSIALAGDEHYSTQHKMHGIGHSDFRQAAVSASLHIQDNLHDMGQSSVGVGVPPRHLRS